MDAPETNSTEREPRVRRPNTTVEWEGITSERLHELKRSRGAAKGAVTKKRNELMELLINRGGIDKQLITSRLSDLEHVMHGQ